jgi:hypothetical protein
VGGYARASASEQQREFSTVQDVAKQVDCNAEDAEGSESPHVGDQ